MNHESATASDQQAPYVRKSKVKKSEALWLLSFTDLSMILISFFILMLSFANVDKQKAEVVAETLRENVKGEVKPDTIVKISQKLNDAIKQLKIDKNAEVIYDTAGLSIEFKDALLFSFGSAEPNPQFKKVVKQIMDLIAKTPDKFTLRFEGHTDDVPVIGGRYASNWELSAARGIALMRQFESRGVAPQRMSVLAYAQTRPKVNIGHLPKDALEKARAQNRRVVIRIE